jgi:hypothetical protein
MGIAAVNRYKNGFLRGLVKSEYYYLRFAWQESQPRKHGIIHCKGKSLPLLQVIGPTTGNSCADIQAGKSVPGGADFIQERTCPECPSWYRATRNGCVNCPALR